MARAAAEAAEEEVLSLGNRCCRGRSGRLLVAAVSRGVKITRRGLGGVLGPKKVVGCGSQSRGAYRGQCRGEKPASQLEAPVLSGKRVLQMLSEASRGGS